jgi:DNA-binding PadR family transcriptional regulator
MKDYKLGEFEEIVLLTVGLLHTEAYGVAIKDKIESQAKRSVSVGALQSALRRMEQKGYLASKPGEPNAQRGGKPKLFFSITAYGLKAVQHSKDLRNELYNAIPQAAHEVTFAW